MIDIKNSSSSSNVDEAIIKTISNVLENGSSTDATKFSNSQDPSVELENFQFTLDNPLDRISVNPYNPLNLIASMGRFVWIIAGNDRLSDIAFYQDKVKDYTDNGFTVPGSDYGKRIFNPDEGVDQIVNVIKLLREDPNSRRAIIPIWTTNDSTRLKSNDLPCAFGLSFIIRNNKLHSTLIMRSNNALRLLNVNLFEFTLIGEIVARELDIEYEKHTHYSVSMHIFQNDVEKIKKWIDLPSEETCSIKTRISMPAMPKSPSPLSEAKELAKLEATLRNENVLKDSSHIYEHLKLASDTLSPYWYEFYRILVIGALICADDYEKVHEMVKDLPSYFKNPIEAHLNKIRPTVVPVDGTLDHYLPEQSSTMYSEISKAFRPDEEETRNILEVLETHVEDIERNKDKILTAKEYRFLEKKFLNKSVIAARSTGDDDNAEDLRKISKAEVEEIFDDVIGGRD